MEPIDDWEVDADAVLQLPQNASTELTRKLQERKLQEDDDLLLVEMMMSGTGIAKEKDDNDTQLKLMSPPPFVSIRKPKKNKKQTSLLQSSFLKPKTVETTKQERKQVKDKHREKMFGDLVEDDFDDFDTEVKILGW